MDSENSNTQALPAGTQLGEFTLEKVLGAGGFGITYLALDTSLGRKVVIKENLPAQFCFRDPGSLTVAARHSQGEDADNFEWSLRNFSREASILASLDHPGIVGVLRSFEAFGTAYFVMPFVEGRSFDCMIEERWQGGGVFSEEELRGLLWYSLDALDHLHAREIFHRDIKPGNLLITSEGVPVLIDFGSARQRLGENSLTVVESAGYTPFEQLQSQGHIGPWTDLYSMGASLVRAITNGPLPKAADRVVGDPWGGLSNNPQWQEAYSPGFLRAIDKAVAVEPADRWQSGREWLEAMAEGGATIAAVPPPPAKAKGASSKLIFSAPPPAASHPGATHPTHAVTPQAVAVETFTTTIPSLLPAQQKSGRGKIVIVSVLAVGLVVGIWVVVSSGNQDGSRSVPAVNEAALAAERHKAAEAEARANEAQRRMEEATAQAAAAKANQSGGKTDRRLTETSTERRHREARELEEREKDEEAKRIAQNERNSPRPESPPKPPPSEPPKAEEKASDAAVRGGLAVLSRGTLEEAKECVRLLEAVEKKFPDAPEISKIKAAVMEVFRAEGALNSAIQAMPKAQKAADDQNRNAEIAERPSSLSGRVDTEGAARCRAEAERIMTEAQKAIQDTKNRLLGGLDQAKTATGGRWGQSVEEVWSLVARRNQTK